jgi:hypothetical protein
MIATSYCTPIFVAILCCLVNSVTTDFVPGKNCSCVAFRLDDIQDFFVTTAQLSIISLFKELQMPLTAGVIANYFGNDPDIVTYIQANLNEYPF